MDSLDGDSVVDNADTNKNVSTNPLTSLSCTYLCFCPTFFFPQKNSFLSRFFS